jgi:transcription antitermination factor NusG
MSKLEFTPGQIDWYALQVRARWEQSTADLLTFKGYETLLPSYAKKQGSGNRQEAVVRPLFPGYLFCRFDVLRRLPILITPGVRAVVSRGRIPIPVDPSEIASIQKLVEAGARAEPCSYIPAGDTIRVERGPLKGLLGILIAHKGSHRVVVSVSLLQRSVALEIDRASVRAIGNSLLPDMSPEPEFDPAQDFSPSLRMVS